MNTTTGNKTENRGNVLSLKFIATALFICLFNLNTVYAGVNLTGFRVTSNTTGNGFGGNVFLAADLKLGHGTLSFGPNFQMRKLNLSGLQCNYSYSIGKNNYSNKYIYFFGNVYFNFSSYLSKSVIKRENFVCKEEKSRIDYSGMKFSTVEVHAGFGLKVVHSDKISTFWGI